MSWSNPSAEEAVDNYRYYRNCYENAAYARSQVQNRANNCANQRNSYVNQLNNCQTQKTNFEKRLQDLLEIIAMLEGRSSMNDVPSFIASAARKLQGTDSVYRSAIRKAGTAAADIANSFKVKTIAEDAHASSALTQYRNEKTRLETNIANLNAQINNLSGVISDLNRQIQSLNAQSDSLRNTMLSSVYEMNHYQKYID